MQRDLTVLKKNLGEFVGRTIIQPFLLVFVFLYVFPQIGQGIGGRGTAAESAFATVLVAGVIGISIMFQGIMSVALPMATSLATPRRSRTGSWRRCRCGWWRSARWPRARSRA